MRSSTPRAVSSDESRRSSAKTSRNDVEARAEVVSVSVVRVREVVVLE